MVIKAKYLLLTPAVQPAIDLQDPSTPHAFPLIGKMPFSLKYNSKESSSLFSLQQCLHLKKSEVVLSVPFLGKIVDKSNVVGNAQYHC